MTTETPDAVGDGGLLAENVMHFARVLRAGGDPAKVVFSGVAKTREEMAAALNAGIHCFNVESLDELRLLDEVAARSSGIDVARYKMIAFAVSGFVGGVGGSLYAVWSGTVATKALDIWQSILILCAVVLGGMGSIKGVLVGSAILSIWTEYSG